MQRPLLLVQTTTENKNGKNEHKSRILQIKSKNAHILADPPPDPPPDPPLTHLPVVCEWSFIYTFPGELDSYFLPCFYRNDKEKCTQL